MMITDKAIIKENINIAKDIYKMTLETKIANLASQGQFVEIEVEGYFLRRPISICEIKENEIVIIYKVVGDGTKVMSSWTSNKEVSLFGPCGNGFPLLDEDITLIGGGIGVPPLYECAKRYIANNKNVNVILGFNTKEDCILEEEFKKLGCEVNVATMDGSYGDKGTVLDSIDKNNIKVNTILACGPLGMLKAINDKYDKGYLSLEARMACGMGACMGCVVKDVNDNSLRVCHDGPVFEIGRIKL